MIITFTGAQSSGKSTLLSKMREDEYFKSWVFVPEITRSLKDKYKLSINENGDNFTQMITIHSHVDNFLNCRYNNSVLDRCALDAFVYTTYLSYKKNVDKELGYYAEYVCNKLLPLYDVIFYTDPSIPLVNDGVRSIDIDFRNKIIELFEFFIDHYKPNNLVRLSGDVETRYKIITATIKNKNL